MLNQEALVMMNNLNIFSPKKFNSSRQIERTY